MTTSDRYGSLHIVEGRHCLHFGRRLHKAPPSVWHAITDSGELRRWFPADLQGERAQDAEIRIVSFTGRFPPAAGRFTAYDPHRLLEYTWGNERLLWKLNAKDAGCNLAFTNTLDENAMKIGIANVAAAWHACLDALDFVLADETPPFTPDDRFAQISPEYADRFRNEAVRLSGDAAR